MAAFIAEGRRSTLPDSLNGRRFVCLAGLIAAFAIWLLVSPSGAFATALPSTITEDATLTAAGSPYTGTSTLASGVTLNVLPGVELSAVRLTVKGTLDVEGTEAEPAVFTGGGYSSLTFEPGSGASVVDHAEIVRSGGIWCCTSAYPAIAIKGSSPTIRNSTFRESNYIAIEVTKGGSPEIANNHIYKSKGWGVYYSGASEYSGEISIVENTVEGGIGYGGIYVSTTGAGYSAKALTGNTIVGNEGVGLKYSGADIPGGITGNSLSANETNVIEIDGTVAHSTTWNNGGTEIKLSGPVTIASGVTLAITHGVYISNARFTVKGTLNVEGTAAEPVVLTGSGYATLAFEPGSDASVVEHTELSKGGGVWCCGTVYPTIAIQGSSPTIRYSTIRESNYAGIEVTKGGSPEIANNHIYKSKGWGIYYFGASGYSGEVNMSGNAVEGGIGYGGIRVSTSGATYSAKALTGNTIIGNEGVGLYYSGADIPGGITGNVLSGNKTNVIEISGTVAHSSTWNNGGTEIVLSGSVTIASGVTLKITQGVYISGSNFTIKGTLDVEGTATEPVVFLGGSYTSLAFESGSGGSVVDHAEIIKGGGNYGGGSLYPAIAIKGSSPTIRNSTIRESKYIAIKVTESGHPTIEWNRFRNNASGGISYTGTGKLSAPNNDWNCLSGPQPAGCGDSVTANVEWKPAQQLPELAGHCRGKESQCGEGADPVSLATGALDYSHSDLSLANKSQEPLELTRTYSSGSTSDTGLGPGWSQTGLASATELASGEVLVVRQDGRQDLFQKSESGYTAPSGVTDALAKVEGTFQLTTLEGSVYRFEAGGRIASITDSHGLKTTYAYNSEGRLATITDPSAQTLTFAYNASNHIISVKDSTGREVKFAYTSAGDLESVTDALGGVTKYGYDGQHRLTSITDPRGNIILKNTYNGEGKITEQRDGLENLWKLEYKAGETIVSEPGGGKRKYGFDTQDRVISETDQVGHVTTTGYDPAGNIHEVVQPGGAKWVFGHDAAGNLTSVKDPEGGERKYEYNAQNRPISFSDARGNAWSYEWSKAGDLLKTVDPEGGETTLTYNESGQPLTSTDPDKHKTEFSWDSRGNELSTTDPLGHKTSFEYNTRNYLTAKTAPGLKAETFERDALGDLLARTTPEAHKTKYSYDKNGLVTQVTDPAEDVWKIERNAMERPTVYTDPLEQQEKITYNGDLKPVKVVNRRGKETIYGYDLANRLIEVNRPEGGDWRYGYDARGNRSSVIDPREHETTYEYDLLNRMIAADEPLGVTTEYGYDTNGDLTSVTDPRGNTTEYGYNKLGHLTEIAQPLEKTTTYTYDPAGNRLTQTTAAGTLELGYDAANRLTEVAAGESTLRSLGYDADNRLASATDAEGHKIEIDRNEDGLVSSINDGRGQSLTRSYNSRGELTKQVDGRGTLEYGYDKLGRLTSLTDPQGKALGFGYDPEGNLTEVTRPSGVTTANVYDDAGRLAETTSKDEGGTVLESLEDGYDAAGDLTSKVDRRLEQETTYAYDALDRLTEFNLPGEGATSYGYDKAGNRTEAGGTTYTFNALNQLTEASDGTTYSYDGAGRMIGQLKGSEETSYEWNLLDQLTGVEGPGETTSYGYDGLERLSERKAEAGTTVFHYGDLTDLPTYLANGEGEPTMSYVQGSHGLIEQRAGESTSYPLTDAHGDITAITGPAGEVESRQSYGPWGEQLSGPSLEMGYLGAWERPTDPATQLIQMGARSYDPSLGRFLSEDSVIGHLGVGASADRYLYVWDDPLNRYDLNGRDVCVLGACASEAAEDIANTAEEFGDGWSYVDEGAGQVGSATASAAGSAWSAAAPARSWVANQAQDFWKEYGSPLESAYKFAGANWESCSKGAAPGAAIGASAGSAAFGVGTVPGAIGGGVLGCGAVVGATHLVELGL